MDEHKKATEEIERSGPDFGRLYGLTEFENDRNFEWQGIPVKKGCEHETVMDGASMSCLVNHGSRGQCKQCFKCGEWIPAS